tara:strand:+ start:125 stop:646 length:522 start_codon:yes stop_codon:yes gene_type:complete
VKARLAKIFAGISALLITLILIGFLRPALWSAESSIEIAVEPIVIFPYLNDLNNWDEWTIWSDIESELTEPSHGKGAKRQWTDENFGSGSIVIVESDLPHSLRYEVTIDSGAQIYGEFLLTELSKGTLVTWRENGNLGTNPLMSYLAKRIGASQAKQMQSGLEGLRTKVSDSP